MRLSGKFLPVLAAIIFGMNGVHAAQTEPLRWWKGNLHTHSLWSDGDHYPEMIVDWYKLNGYQFLMLSDHNTFAEGERWINAVTNKGGRVALEKYLHRFGPKWVETRNTKGWEEVRLKTLGEFRGRFEEPGRFLLLQGEELTDRYKVAPVHMGVVNTRKLIKPQGGDSVLEVIQNNVNAVLAVRDETRQPMFPHVNHPNFGWGITAEELMQVKGEKFFEVYNGHPAVHNEGDSTHSGTERMWDIILTKRLAELGLPVMFGLATDDSHNYHTNSSKVSNSGRGWVMVHAPRLAADDLVHSLEAGDFYASSGVTLKSIQATPHKLEVTVEREAGISYTTQFIGTRRNYDSKDEVVHAPNGEALRVTHRYSADIGAVLAEVKGAHASYTFKGDEIYVRAKIISSKLKKNPYLEGEFEAAWVQPVVPGNRN